MRNLVLNEAMGPAVLARLQELSRLPESGYVAGQAVASAVSEIFGDGRAVRYNDVDVFRGQNAAELTASRLAQARHSEGIPRAFERSIQTHQFTTGALEEDYGEIVFNTMSRYKVLKTLREGLLNEVLCSFSSKDAQQFLATFDMNCVQVCVDLETKKLHWTKPFEAFCHTRQLEIVALHTPCHSLIRYFHKRRELEGIYGNDERMVEMVGAAWHWEEAFTDSGLHTRNVHWDFGKKQADRLQEVSGSILPAFELQTRDVLGYPVSTLRPRFATEKDLLGYRTFGTQHTLPVISRALREKTTKGRSERIEYLLKADNTKSLLKKVWLCKQDDFVRGNISLSQMAELDRVNAEHRIAGHLNKDSLVGMWNSCELVRSEARQRGAWVWGVLETTVGRQWTAGSLKEALDEQEILLGKTLKKVDMPTATLFGYEMRELVTGMDLFLEGVEMHHCVGGYAQGVKDRFCRILAFAPVTQAQPARPDQRFTVELRRGARGWSCGQTRGLQNRMATDSEARLGTLCAVIANISRFVGYRAALHMAKNHPQVMLKFGEKLENIQSLFDRKALVVKVSRRLEKRFGHDQVNAAVVCSPYHRPGLYWGHRLKDALTWTAKTKQNDAQKNWALKSATAGELELDDEIPF